MKLRNIFLASLAVCTMASCSKDETIDYSQMGPVDAYVSLAATSAIQTKATVDTEGNELLNGEKYINSLTAYVFKQTDGTLAGVKHLTVAGADEALVDATYGLKAINHIVVKVTPNAEGTSSTDQFTAVIVANCEQLNVSSLTDLKSKTIATALTTPADVKGGKAYLPMASAETKFGNLVPNIVVNGATSKYTENWINGTTIHKQESTPEAPGDPEGIPAEVTNPISLKRLVARVQVEKLIFNLEEQYPGASFKLTNLALVNVRPSSTVEIGNGKYVKGYVSNAYAVSQKWISPSSTFVSALGKAYTYDAFSGKNQTVDFNTDPTYKDDKFCVYAYSNAEVPTDQVDAVGPDYTNDNNIYQTALLIAGEFKRSSSATGEVRHFRVLLKDGSDPVKVLANHVYKLTVTITGEGSPNEDEIRLNTHVAATIEVAPWNVIEQNEEDAN